MLELKNKHKGAKSELIAAAWLLSNGHEVFRNVSDRGLIDLVSIKDYKIYLFDVKTGTYKNRNGEPELQLYKISKDQHELGVKLLYVINEAECLIVDNPDVNALLKTHKL